MRAILTGWATVFSLMGNSQDNVYRISGNVEGLQNDSVVLYINHFDKNGKRTKADTLVTKADKGAFNFSGKVPTAQLAWINYGGLRTRKSTSFFLEPGNIAIAGNLEQADKIRAKGTLSNDQMTGGRNYTAAIYDRIQTLYNQLKDTPENSEEAKQLKSQIAIKQDSVESYEVSFIRNNPTSLYTGTLIYVKQDRLPIDELEALYNKLSPEVKNMPLVIPIKDKIKARRLVAIGNIAPAFAAPDTSGRMVKLSDFKGRYVLLEFWAQWCVPCRQQSPHLVKLFDKFHEKGFDIVQYSIDDKKDELKWKQAIVKDGLQNWTHLSELKGFESTVSRMYGVQPIPDNFLIAPDGTIVGRRLEGELLEKKLEELLNTSNSKTHK